MWAGIWATLKGFAVAIGWAKQASDQSTGRKLERGENATRTLETVAKVDDARADPAIVDRVREQSYRD